MKPIINIVGVILIVLGIATLAYRQFNYTETEKIAQMKVKIYYIPVLLQKVKNKQMPEIHF